MARPSSHDGKRRWQPTLTQLKALLSVADAGSFSAAATELNLTQSSLSHAINELERGLSERLLVRSSRGTMLTEAGTRVAGTARQIFSLVLTLKPAPATATSITGHVSISCYRSVATHLLPGIISQVHAEHPAIEIEIDDGNLERDDTEHAVLQGRAELGFAHLPVDPRLQATPIIEDEYVLVLPKSNRRRMTTWQDLETMPYINLGRTGFPFVLEICRQHGYRGQPIMSLLEDSSILALVAQGAGFSILPRLAIDGMLDGVRFSSLPTPIWRTIGLIRASGVQPSAAARVIAAKACDRNILAGLPALRRGLCRLVATNLPGESPEKPRG